MQHVRTLLQLTALLVPTLSLHALPHGRRVAEARGPHFRVVCHFGRAAAAEAALEAAEAVWPIATRVYGVDQTPPPVPWEIHLFKERDNFDAACLATAGRTWPEHSGVTTRAGVSILQLGHLYSDDVFERIGLPLRELALVAHEATHLVGFHRAGGYQRHPEWLTEGLAEWVAQRAAAEQGWSLGPDDDPSGATDIVYLQEFLQDERLPRVERILADDLDDVGIGHRYALYGAFMSFLFDTIYSDTVVKSMRMKRLVSREHFARVFRYFLPLGGVQELDRSFQSYLEARKPSWTLESGWLERRGEDWIHVAPEEWAAMAWRRPWLGGGDYSLSGELTSFASAVPQRLDVLFARLRWSDQTGDNEWWRDRFLSVSFSSETGVQVYAHFRGEEGSEAVRHELELIAESDEGRLATGTITFRVDVHTDHGHVFVDERDVLRFELPEGSASGRGQWGVMADAGSFAVWRALRASE